MCSTFSVILQKSNDEHQHIILREKYINERKIKLTVIYRLDPMLQFY